MTDIMPTIESTLDTDFLVDFATLSTFGATPRGGVDRQAGTTADGEQRAWLHTWLTDHGFDVRYDLIGNQFGLHTFDADAPYVLTGSHLDSQPLGGRFDGAYGVLASAHAATRAIARWRQSGERPAFNIAVVNWFNEEGSRFTPSMMGSSVFTGKLAAAEALSTVDSAGVSVQTSLTSMGTVGDFEPPKLSSYAEIHIEQGRILENTHTTIGLVAATWAARKFRITVIGDQSHTGATVMADRRDALLGAAHLIVFGRELADTYAEAPLHTSVSQIVAEPNSPVVITREAVLHLDLRSPDDEVLEKAEHDLTTRIAEVEDLAQVDIRIERTHAWNVDSYQPEGVALSRAVADDLGLSHRTMYTVAGHDSTNVKDVVPTVMLFVPSVDGISHNEGEYTRDEDSTAGVAMLTEVVYRMMAGRLSDRR